MDSAPFSSLTFTIIPGEWLLQLDVNCPATETGFGIGYASSLPGSIDRVHSTLGRRRVASPPPRRWVADLSAETATHLTRGIRKLSRRDTAGSSCVRSPSGVLRTESAPRASELSDEQSLYEVIAAFLASHGGSRSLANGCADVIVPARPPAQRPSLRCCSPGAAGSETSTATPARSLTRSATS
jgi:hypothetical protein